MAVCIELLTSRNVAAVLKESISNSLFGIIAGALVRKLVLSETQKTTLMETNIDRVNGLVPSGSKSLLESLLTEIFVAICSYKVKMRLNTLRQGENTGHFEGDILKLSFAPKFMEICSKVSKWHYVIIGLDNWLTLNRLQVIVWIKDSLGQWHMYASTGLEKLTLAVQNLFSKHKNKISFSMQLEYFTMDNMDPFIIKPNTMVAEGLMVQVLT